MSTSARSADTVEVRAPQPARSGVLLSVRSETFRNGESLATELAFSGCGGKNVSPQLSWSNFPDGTKSFAITCFDPDAPTGSGYWHWLVCDIPLRVTTLEAGAGAGDAPGGGKTAYNDYGLNTYGGPCPPPGDAPHRYIFTVYAIDVPSLEGVGRGTTGASFIFSMRGHVLASGSITGRYAR
jgi:Raf kinase inhibitor-like YbhB/YbcL family protein